MQIDPKCLKMKSRNLMNVTEVKIQLKLFDFKAIVAHSHARSVYVAVLPSSQS